MKDGVKILCELDGHIVAAEEKNMLVTSFHPELTDNTAFLKYFLYLRFKKAVFKQPFSYRFVFNSSTLRVAVPIF